ncbi:hypothetical protein [Asanoa siamensis]|uniref:Uncharacterized protein n=1 Tax=Asanoa siamensis TaxID=926357 RepID=A0ABQ4CKP4_9ACTN|nr:hypothetical protein [Asanoa siamensis]GIF71867.1 hypothetical protein Asi02nite_13850 [Asanoa siamensis]
MSHDLYKFLAKPAEPDDDRDPKSGRDKRDPNTALTASVETIDNDRATYLLGNVSL